MKIKVEMVGIKEDLTRELKERLDRQGTYSEVVGEIIIDMKSKYPEIWDILPTFHYERRDDVEASKGYCFGTETLESIVIILGRAKCDNCGEDFRKEREWAKFCSDKCRQASFREKNKKDSNS